MSTLRECRRYAITHNMSIAARLMSDGSTPVSISPEGEIAERVTAAQANSEEWMIAVEPNSGWFSRWFYPDANGNLDAFDAIASERRYQDLKWGDSESSGEPGLGGYRTIDEFALYITEYTDQLRRECGTSVNPRSKLDLMRKVGALCVSAMEWHGAPRRAGFEHEPESLPDPLPDNIHPSPTNLVQSIEHALNTHSAENGSNTSDFVLADFLLGCLKAFDNAVIRRDQWYHGRVCEPGQSSSSRELLLEHTESHGKTE